jgi:S1-C subfamily serine protease
MPTCLPNSVVVRFLLTRSSGGPLLDSRGRLVGVNTAIFSTSGAFTGVGFSIPVKFVKKSVSDIIEYGRVIRPSLGVYLAPDYYLKQVF